MAGTQETCVPSSWEKPHTELGQVPVIKTHFPLQSALASNRVDPLGLLPSMIVIQAQHNADWADRDHKFPGGWKSQQCGGGELRDGVGDHRQSVLLRLLIA